MPKDHQVEVQVAHVTLIDQAWMGQQLEEEKEQEKHPLHLEQHIYQLWSKSHAPINLLYNINFM